MLTAIVNSSDSLNCEVVAVCVMLTGCRWLSAIWSRSFGEGINVGARIVIAVFVGLFTVLIGPLRVPYYSLLCCSSCNGAGKFITMFAGPFMEPECSLPCLQSVFWNQKIQYHVYKASFGSMRFISMFTKPLFETEYPLPCSQNLLWIHKIHYHIHRTSCGSTRSITMFTEPLVDPQDPLPCSQISLGIHKIYYRDYKARQCFLLLFSYRQTHLQ
jgi:hypothetical protein